MLEWDWTCPRCGYVNERWGDLFRTRVCDHCTYSPDSWELPEESPLLGIE